MLNPATLSGCIDIIAVEQPDGLLKCSPFHVRFGKAKVMFKPEKKHVCLFLNGSETQIKMDLTKEGEAVFREPPEEDEGGPEEENKQEQSEEELVKSESQLIFNCYVPPHSDL